MSVWTALQLPRHAFVRARPAWSRAGIHLPSNTGHTNSAARAAHCRAIRCDRRHEFAATTRHYAKRNFLVAIEQINIVSATSAQRRLRARDRFVIERVDAGLYDLYVQAAGARDAAERHKPEQQPRERRSQSSDGVNDHEGQISQKDRRCREFSGFGRSGRMLRNAPVKGNW